MAETEGHSGDPGRAGWLPTIILNGPLDLHRANPADYSVAERVTLQSLGVDHFDFERMPFE